MTSPAQALKTNDPAEKTRLYKAAQDIIWQESPWIPLVVEKLVSAHSKNLTGFWDHARHRFQL